jgi:TolB protein
MKHRHDYIFIAMATVGLALAADAALADGQAQGDKGPATSANDADPLANIVVTGTSGERPLPKLAVLPSLAPDMEDVTLRSVVRRDLELSGEFDVLPDSAAPDGVYLADSPVDIKAWQAKGAEALVRVTGKKLSDTKAELRGQAFLVSAGPDPLYDKKFEVPLADVRVESHRVADLLIGALTGQNGSFASHMTFASGTGTVRQVFTMDADGFNAKPVSPASRVALAPTYGPNDELYYSASENKDVYKVFTASGGPLKLNVDGSVYGLTFSHDRKQVAAAIGQGDSIKMFLGPSLTELKPASTVGMALRPVFTPSGKLAFAGEGKFGQRIYVDGKPISPDGFFASSPTFCRNPDGIKAIFAVGVGKNTDLVVTGENGGQLVRITQNQGSNGYPACSPDGRLVAFFSTRKSGEGPGLYVMRVDGGRAKRISSLMGDSLRWDPLPPSKAIDTKDPPPKAKPADVTPAAANKAPEKPAATDKQAAEKKK